MALQKCKTNIMQLLNLAVDDAKKIDDAFKELQKRQRNLSYISVLAHLVSTFGIDARPFFRKKYAKAQSFCRIIPLILVFIQILRVWKIKFEICGLKREAKRRMQSLVDTLYGDEKKDENNEQNGSDESNELPLQKPKWTETTFPKSNLFYESFVGILHLISFYLIFRKPKPKQSDYDIPFDIDQRRHLSNALWELNAGFLSNFGDIHSKFQTYQTSFTEKVKTQIRDLMSNITQKSSKDTNRYVVPNLSAKVDAATWRKMKPYGEKIDQNTNDIIQYCKHCLSLMLLYNKLFSLQEKDALFNRMWLFVKAGINLSKEAESLSDIVKERAIGHTGKRNADDVVNFIKQMKTFAQNAAKLQKKACKISTTQKGLQGLKDIVKQIKSYSPSEQFHITIAKNEVKQNRNAIEKIWNAKFKSWIFNCPIETDWVDDWILSAEAISSVLGQKSLPIFKEGVEVMTDALGLASEEREENKVLVAAKNIGTDVLKIYKEALSNVELERQGRERNQISTESIEPVRRKLLGVFEDAKKIADFLQIDVSLNEASQRRAQWIFIRKIDTYQYPVLVLGIGVDVLFWRTSSTIVSHPFSNSLRRIKGKIMNDFPDIFQL